MPRATSNHGHENELPPPALKAKRPLEVQKRRGLLIWVATALVFVIALVVIVVIAMTQ